MHIQSDRARELRNSAVVSGGRYWDELVRDGPSWRRAAGHGVSWVAYPPG